MMLQLSAVLWATFGFYIGSIKLFVIGGILCILLDLIKIAIKISNGWLLILAYTIGYTFLGSYNGILFAAIITNTIEILIHTGKNTKKNLMPMKQKSNSENSTIL